jgi:hypothetical protein
MKTPLELKLRTLTKHWRQTGEKVRVVAMDMPHMLARGHMHGMSDGLDVAAEDVDKILDDANAGQSIPDKPTAGPM